MSSVLILVLFISIPLTVNALLGPFRCDYKYVPYAGGWYKLHPIANTWNQANIICNMEGAELASPTSDDVIDAMKSLMFDYDSVIIVHTAGQPIDELKVILGGDEVVALHINGGDQKVNQSDLYPYICHKKGPALVELNECGTIDDEYHLDGRTGRCYKFHQLRANWYEATLTCQVEGGQLTVINSEDEAQAIREVFASNPPELIPGVDWKDNAFVGFWKLEDNWTTVNGQSLAQAGYDAWSPGEPNNARGDEFCGSVGRNGKLFDGPCSRALPFICEKKTDIDCKIQDSSSSLKIHTMMAERFEKPRMVKRIKPIS